eukprot:gb/GFBE01055561.1/.p1 GENE.gb/GFBE01055561.1/~~gb/GFBE01055561.1/.p1  ORF type:complete len:248 (+),score=65.99 gb/GFBE01055561.1/:1-744(+)
MMRSALWLLALRFHAAFANNLPPEMMSSAVGKKPTRLAKSEPYIKCDTCKIAAREAWTQVEAKAKRLPAGKLGEVEVGEVLDSLCDSDDDLGEWLTFYDVVQKEDGDVLTLDKKDSVGECRRECNTMVHICRAVFDEYREDMTEMLFKHYRPADSHSKSPSKGKLNEEKFVSRVCTKLSKSCPAKTPPKGFKHKDEHWVPVFDEEGYKMRRMQHAINKAAKEGGTQPVQFLDPMGAGMFGNEDDEDL